MSPPPPTKASSRTVTSIEVPFLRVVLDLDPTFERDKHDELFYPFGEAGHRARNFYGDPYVSGAYAPPVSGSPVNTNVPVVLGIMVVGQTLTADVGAWSGSPTSFNFQWFQNGFPIIGAVSQTYVPTVGDAGKMINVGVSGTNDSVGTGAIAFSIAVGPISTTMPPTVGPKKRKKPTMNRISTVIPSHNNSQLAQMRDEAISKLISTMGVGGDLYHYVDNSPLLLWAYLYIGQGYVDGIYTVGTVYCSGVTNPSSGTNVAATADPGVAGPYSSQWVAVGALPIISTSGDLGKGVSPPAGNNNYYVWNIPANSPSVVADFTNAVTLIGNALAGGITTNVISRAYLKYVDSVSGAWQVTALYFGAGSAEYAAPSPVVLPNNNIQYVVTCSGTPSPPAGVNLPAVSLPAFVQSFTTIGSPLNFGPQR